MQGMNGISDKGPSRVGSLSLDPDRHPTLAGLADQLLAEAVRTVGLLQPPRRLLSLRVGRAGGDLYVECVVERVGE